MTSLCAMAAMGKKTASTLAEKVVYLDEDVVVKGDLFDLFNVSMSIVLSSSSELQFVSSIFVTFQA